MQELVAADRPDDARKLAARLETDAGDAPAVWEILGSYYRQDDNPHRAVRCFETALKHQTATADIQRLARSLTTLYQKLENTLQAYRTALILTEVTADRSLRVRHQRLARTLEARLLQQERRVVAAAVRGLQAVPAPGKVVVDGKLEEWDLSGQVTACNDVHAELDVYSTRIALMYDEDYLYIALQFRDWTPMQSRIEPRREYARGWSSDSVQIRFRFPDKLSNLDCWYYRPRQESVVYRQHGGGNGQPVGGGPERVYRSRESELDDGLEQVFRTHENGRDYTQELRVPWAILTARKMKANDQFHSLFQMGWGERRRDHQITANVAAGKRIHAGLWMTPAAYGPVRLAPQGNLEPAKPEWQLALGRHLEQLWRRQAHTQAARAVTFTPDGKSVASAGLDGTIGIWRADSGGAIGKLADHKSVVNALAFSPNGAWLASAGEDKVIRLWDPQTQQITKRLTGHTKTIWDLRFGPRGKRLLSGGLDGTVRFWDIASREARVYRAPRGVRAVALSPTGKRVAAGCLDTKVYVWDRQGDLQQTLAGSHRFGVRSVAFLADGRHLLSGGDDLRILLWDVRTGKVVRKFLGHASLVTHIELFDDGKRFLSTALDGDVRVWELESGKTVLRRKAGRAGIWAAALAPDNRSVATAGRDGCVRLIKTER